MNISQASKLNHISADTLRYYEKIGLIPPIKRTAGGNRDYCEEDFKWIEFAKCMRAAGLSIEVLTEYLALFKEGEQTEEQRRNLLIEQRELLRNRMKHMQLTLDKLDHKIENYHHTLLKKEQYLAKYK